MRATLTLILFCALLAATALAADPQGGPKSAGTRAMPS